MPKVGSIRKNLRIDSWLIPMSKMSEAIRIFRISFFRIVMNWPKILCGLNCPPYWYPKASGISTAAMMMDTVSVPLPT